MQSRKKNSARNIITGLISKVIVFVFAFICRTVFVRLLGAEYTGINGLYTNILTVLALADLGIGNVFSFSLYKYLANDDKNGVAGLIAAFRKLYIIIGLVIFSCGLLVIPLLPVIVKSTLPIDKVCLYYVLSLLNSVASYFFVYKTTILIADQKQYITNIWTTVFQCVMYSAQIGYLLCFKDFTGYLVIQIVCTISRNILLSLIADKNYGYIKKGSEVKPIRGQFHNLWNNIKATFIYKICTVALTNTDNLLISMILGTAFVGYYSNYFMLVQYVAAYVFILTSGLHASVGNYQATSDIEKSYSLFRSLNFVYSTIACVVITIFISCIQDFIPLWVGKEYVLGFDSVIAILLVLYIDIVLSPITLYRETLGLFTQVQYIMVPAAIINIILSIILGNWLGLAGIILATSISKLLTCSWYEPMILYKFFNRNLSEYFLKQITYLLTTILSSAATFYIVRNMPKNLPGIFLRALSGLLVALLFSALFNIRSSEIRYLLGLVKPMLARNKR